MSAEDRHGHDPGRRGRTAQHFGVGGEPLPVLGGLRGLGKIALAIVALVGVTAIITAVVALLY